MSKTVLKSELLLTFHFEATHSLSDYETPHSHPWQLSFGLTGRPIEGRIIDLPLLRKSVLNQLLSPLEKTDLNLNPVVNQEVRQSPTCETLSEYFFSKLKDLLNEDFLFINPTIRLTFVTVSLFERDSLTHLPVEVGAVRLTQESAS